jgi:hypothetical protein
MAKNNGPKIHIQGEYPADWPHIADRVRESVGHRCIRCGHRYKTGEHGKGEWTPCDEHCTHGGPVGKLLADGSVLEGPLDVVSDTELSGFGVVVAQWRILTVHHLDGNKANCEWWNLLSLCQRCHLQIQTRLNPQLPYFLEHSEWFKPYVAGFYAHKYENRNITREEAIQRMEELLAYERRA